MKMYISIYYFWFDPTWNQSQVYCLSNNCFLVNYHSKLKEAQIDIKKKS